MPSAVRVVPACLALLLLLGACAVEGRDLLAIKNDDGDSSGKAGCKGDNAEFRCDETTSYTASTELTLREDSLATIGPVPEAEGFKQAEPSDGDKGTCNLDESLDICGDGMDDGAADGTSDGDFAAVADPDHAFECSFADLDSLVEQVSDWAYFGRWGRCGVRAYTVSKLCVGSGAAEGRIRVKFMLWPDSDKCKPICVKIRADGDSADVYGRTATC